jgi:hypothetical protein
LVILTCVMPPLRHSEGLRIEMGLSSPPNMNKLDTVWSLRPTTQGRNICLRKSKDEIGATHIFQTLVAEHGTSTLFC